MQSLGILRDSGHEHFNGSLVIPVINDHQVLEIYGRKLHDNLRKGTPKHLYLPGPHQGVFNLEALRASKEIILCESLIDALSFWAAGYRNVTTSYGVEGFTKAHLQAFKDHGTERVLIAYDRDAAGNQAAEGLAKKLIKAGIDCYRLNFPKGMDANEYAVQVQPATRSLGVVIRSAVWLGKGKDPMPPTSTAVAVESPTLDPAATATKNETPPAASTPPLAAETSTPLPATPLPDAPQPDVEAQIKDDDIVLSFGDRRYRVRGLKNNASPSQLKVNVLVSCHEAFHVDTLELYVARQRSAFISQAARELALKDDVIKKDLGRVLLKLEALQEQALKAAQPSDAATVVLSDADASEALALLKAPDLMQAILDDFNTCGVVGEETNKLVGYLAATSRKLDKPLAVMVQSASAAGKSSLMEAVLAFMPDEDTVQYSAMTGQSLYYMEDGNLQHKILAIAEEEGAERASYALKLLQSEGELTIASTGKDPQSGRLVTHEYQVQGPVMLFSTTTSIEPDEELLNRCLVLGVDESRDQTQAIHQLQRRAETLDGLFVNEQKTALRRRHQNAQRLLKPLPVVNPYAESLTFLDDQTRTRRDHMKYLTLIKTITLLHQYQRPVKTATYRDQTKDYIEVTLTDIEIANRLAHDVLGKSLDSLPPQTRRLLRLIDTMVSARCQKLDMDKSDYRFSRKDVREHVGWSDFQVKKHMQRLTDMETVLVHRGGRGQSFVYELLYDGEGQDGEPFLMGLIDVQALGKQAYDEKNAPLTQKIVPPSGPQSAGVESRSSAVKNNVDAINTGTCDDGDENPLKNAHPARQNNAASYVQAPALVAGQRDA
ncbi:MAG: hypothetical protein BMS9Abin09_0092 [Gammaproteobacteria bacterium]|nr:MAG: hypothetical protein BMS9Abin09_0092 [Gammaproteobacteria bacterium]